jgi:SsrA-binding protein
MEAGIVLDGGEVKSLKAGNANLSDSFCLISAGEVFLKNAHVAVYDKASAYNVKDSRRDRKLLLNKREIIRLKQKVAEKGYTLVPLKLYLKDALIKVELGVCKGKHTYDKKQTLKEKDIKKKTDREINAVR